MYDHDDQGGDKNKLQEFELIIISCIDNTPRLGGFFIGGWILKTSNQVDSEARLIFWVMAKTVDAMTRKEIEATPTVKDWREDIGKFDSLVILPTKRIHDSGYRCMYFVACIDGVPKYKIAGGSDVLHIDGIGGYGYDWLKKFGTVPRLVEPTDWSIDCLKISGLLRLFTHGDLTCGPALSSFELYSERKQKVAK